MVKVNIREAKAHLSQLLIRVACGEQVVILKRDKPIARLVPFSPPQRRELGRDQGLFTVPENFNDPLSEDMTPAARDSGLRSTGDSPSSKRARGRGPGRGP